MTIHFNLEFFLVVATLISGVMLIVQRLMRNKHSRLYSVIETIASLFVVFFLVLVIRSFLIEPFRIPSGSMIPTLKVGDFILVNKYEYGIRLPVIRSKIMNNNTPARGDVVVFKYPRNTKSDFIKRVIGLPGDDVRYQNRTLYINEKEIKRTIIIDKSSATQKRYSEQFLNKPHDIVLYNKALVHSTTSWKVPAGHYFVMGDNRDNSNDSRSWGFVPESHLVGRAFMIWLNWDWDNSLMDFSRIGTFIE